jgi:hypothetical protein
MTASYAGPRPLPNPALTNNIPLLTTTSNHNSPYTQTYQIAPLSHHNGQDQGEASHRQQPPQVAA